MSRVPESSTASANFSEEPTALRHLSTAQKERLSAILERYLKSLEQGSPLSTETLLKENPDLAESLQSYFTSLDDLHDMAAGFGGATAIGPPTPLPNASGNSKPAENELAADQDERRIGDFQLLREIGRGGMGIVYEARQISLGRRIALKVLPFAAVLDSKQIARFKNEAQAAAQIHHPNIVPVFAIGVERGVHYYAMQFIDGQPLDRVIQELKGTAPATGAAASPTLAKSAAHTQSIRNCRQVKQVIRLGIQAAEALHAAHEYGVVHRDIKPSNLLLDGDGKLWVTDFGLARLPTDTSLTRTGDVLGTMKYMSPEQAAGESALVDHRTDIFSLAATLYELLALRPAFEKREASRDVGLETASPLSLTKTRNDIPADLETVLFKAMSPQRSNRYATAREFAADLTRVLEGKPTVARPPTILDRTTKFARRHRRWVMAGSMLAALGVGGLAVSSILILQEKQRAEHNWQRAERNFREARDVVDRFGAHLAERLAEVPGASQVREELLRETVQYYEGFVEQARHDPALRADLAVTYEKLATLTGEIGSSEAAIKTHETARDLLQQLHQAEPQNAVHLQRLATCQNNLGLALVRAGKLDEARQAYGDAIRHQETLVARYPNESQYITELAASHGNLGLLYSEAKRTAEAEAAFRAAIRSQEQLLNERPSVVEVRRGLAASYNNLASLLAEHEQVQAATSFQKALEHQQHLAAQQPADAKIHGELALTYNNLASLYSQTNALDQAVDCYEAAIQIQSDWLKKAPSLNSFRHELAVSYNNLGLLQVRLGDENQAEQSFRAAIDLHQELLARNPNDATLHSSLGGVFNNLGDWQERAGKLDAAADSYRDAITHQRHSLLAAPEVVRYRSYLSKHLFNLGRVLRQLGRGAEAAELALQRRELWPNAADRLFSVAEELAQAIPTIQSTNKPSSITVETCRKLALETLEQAVIAGYKLPADVRIRDSFAAIRDDARFSALVK